MSEYTERQAQVAVDYCKLLANLKINLVETFYTKAKCVRGCDITTTDGKLLLTNYFDLRLIVLDKQEEHLSTTTISTHPDDAFDVTCIDDTIVAVTSKNKLISIMVIRPSFPSLPFGLPNPHEKIRIDVGYVCWGVTHRDGTLLVCAERHGIMSINLITEEITTIVQCEDLPSHSYITTYKDKLYYTNHESETVTCCDMEGSTLWTFKNAAVLRSPRGITTDNEGRVYVCDDVKDHVIVLSSDGKRSRTIITKADGLNNPYAIYFDKKRNNLLTSNKSGRVFLFNVPS